ncbi:MAG: hypothetical protein IH903_01535 [Proteobacteria bacterium]|nr:hypothetical protein [Pseudomonadota bacterium]
MTRPIWRRPLVVLVLATLVVFISYGTRQSFGLFLRPITMDMGWGREALSFALATQSLMIGISAPFAGFAASLIHWPIDDRPVARLAARQA